MEVRFRQGLLEDTDPASKAKQFHWAKKAGSGPSSQRGQDVQRHWDREDLRRVGTAVCKRAWLDHRGQGGGFTDVMSRRNAQEGNLDSALTKYHKLA